MIHFFVKFKRQFLVRNSPKLQIFRIFLQKSSLDGFGFFFTLFPKERRGRRPPQGEALVRFLTNFFIKSWNTHPNFGTKLRQKEICAQRSAPEGPRGGAPQHCAAMPSICSAKMEHFCYYINIFCENGRPVGRSKGPGRIRSVEGL